MLSSQSSIMAIPIQTRATSRRAQQAQQEQLQQDPCQATQDPVRLPPLTTLSLSLHNGAESMMPSSKIVNQRHAYHLRSSARSLLPSPPSPSPSITSFSVDDNTDNNSACLSRSARQVCTAHISAPPAWPKQSQISSNPLVNHPINAPQDFVLSDHFTGTVTTDAQRATLAKPNPLDYFTEEQTRQVLVLHSILFGGPSSGNTQSSTIDALPPQTAATTISSTMSSNPPTPPSMELGAMAAFKRAANQDLDFDPFSYLNDLDSIPVNPSAAYKGSNGLFENHASAFLSNAFSGYRGTAIEETSPLLTPFGIDDDTPPVATPALEADDEPSFSTSPVWNEFANFALFPDQATSSAPNTFDVTVSTSFSFGAPASTLGNPATISPTDLSLPLPLPVSAESIVPGSVASTSTAASKKKRSVSRAFSREPSEAFVDEEPARAGKRKRTTQPQLHVAPALAAPSFTGTRNTSLPPVSVDAPTQARSYQGPPSKTSKRDVPAAAARKVAALKAQAEVMGGDVEDDIAKSIEEKRRQNTVAARRSRMRKAEHLSNLEQLIQSQQEQLHTLQLEMQVWKQRALDAGWTETSRAI